MICLITGEMSSSVYSSEGLRRLSSRLQELKRLDYSAQEQRALAADMADKISIQGVQPKFSAVLSPSAGEFKVVERNGLYILKPPHRDYEQLPENEALTMDLARRAGVETPPFGLLRNSDHTFTYFIKRFDRKGKKGKLAVEDFAQLSQASRSTKYKSSLERVAGVIEEFCTFPLPEKVRFFRRVLVAFLTGNEDMHLKNFSLVTDKGKVELSPAYDFVNTTIVLRRPTEETALPLRGKKTKLSRDDLVDYFAGERLTLRRPVVDRVLSEIESTIPEWRERIRRDLLSDRLKEAYLDLLEERAKRLFS